MAPFPYRASARSCLPALATVLATGLAAGLAGCAAPAAAPAPAATGGIRCAAPALKPFGRAELYFGRSIPGGGTVTDQQFAEFLDQEVTPRFPDGFSVLAATGQYREDSGTIDHEASQVLVLLYPAAEVAATNRKLDEVRAAYRQRFHQESVLTDEEPTCASF